MPVVSFLGGNGHGAARLERARPLLAGRVDLREISYPGFEDGPPQAPDFPSFLDAVAAQLAEQRPDLVYATGIGGLVALCLRADGRLKPPLVLQGPVLWGLEDRLMPRVMRAVPFAPDLLQRLFRTRAFRTWFVRKHFVTPIPDGMTARFFAAYDACTTLPAFFRWLTPDLLRGLEEARALHPGRFEDVEVWWGLADRVVPLADWAATKTRLGVNWPLTRFPDWGHYPCLEHPESWVRELVRVAST